MNSATGAIEQTLYSGEVVGDEVSVSPNGSTVYFEVKSGCDDQIWSVGVNGSAPTLIVDQGSLPTVSTFAGTEELAYAVQPLVYSAACGISGPYNGDQDFSVAVMNLHTMGVTNYPLDPIYVPNGLPEAIRHLSWSPSGDTLAITLPGAEDNEGQQIELLNITTGKYYVSPSNQMVPLPVGTPGAAYYGEAVYEPNGNLFVSDQCCAGIGPVTSSSYVKLQEVSTAGSLIHQVATGFVTHTHTSLDVDSSGNWLLYLSNTTIYVSESGAPPTALTSGYVAAAWG